MGIAVASIQMDVADKDRDRNIEKAVRMVGEANKRGCRFVLLPEMFVTSFRYEYIEEIAEPLPGTAIAPLMEAARQYQLTILAGSVPERVDEKIYNSSVLISPDGSIAGVYRKIHLFPLMGEDEKLVPGDKLVVLQTEFGRIGFMICYDLRFPELARSLAALGAEIIVVPAQFPYPRLDHWRALLQARAIENQCFILATNRVGRYEHTKFFGHSCLYDPWGELRFSAGDEEGIVWGELEQEKVAEVRQRIPCFKDRRPEIYKL